MLRCFECRQYQWASPGHVPVEGEGIKDRWGFCSKYWKYTRADDVHFSTCPDQPTFADLKDKPETP